MPRSFQIAAALVLVLQLGAAQPARPASPPSHEPPYDWDLESQYSNEAAWSASLATVHERLAKVELLRSVPIANVEDLADRLDEIRFLRGQAGRMARFAILHTQLDDTSQEAKARFDAATALEARVEAGVSWIDAAMLDLGPDRLKEWAAREPRLRAHGWRINRVLSEVSHLPPKGAEAAVASLERAAITPANVYEALMQADLGWPAIKTASDSELRLDPRGYSRGRRDPDQVLGNTYYGQVLAEWAIATASAAAMAERLEANDPETIAALAHPMARPGSFTSYDLLRDAGVDLATGVPYEALYRRMNRLMDALEQELAQ